MVSRGIRGLGAYGVACRGSKGIGGIWIWGV